MKPVSSLIPYKQHEILTLDIETTYGKSFGRVGNPFDPDNFSLCSTGWQLGDKDPEHSYFVREDPETGYRTGGHGVESDGLDRAIEDPNLKLIVGFNIKFDMLWKWPQVRKALARGVEVFDVGYAWYLVTAQFYRDEQEKRFRVSLNNVLRSLGLEAKHDVIKDLWDDGVRTEDIDKDLLIAYQDQDVRQTYAAFKQVWKLAEDKGMLPMIRARMLGLCATTEMEYNGLHVDMERGLELASELADKLSEIDIRLQEFVPEDVPFEFNFGSSVQLSALLFGGTISYQKRDFILDECGNKTYPNKVEKWPLFDSNRVNPDKCDGTVRLFGNDFYVLNGEIQDSYKSGKNKGKPKFGNETMPDLGRPKMKLFDFVYEFKGMFKPNKSWESESKPGQYSTADDVIKKLTAKYPYAEIVTLIKQRRAMSKDLGTYYIAESATGKKTGMLTMVDATGKIHHQLNCTRTKTGRLSSSAPNLQNISSNEKSDVKQVFVSRYGENGYMVEADYHQLEVITKAVLSGDKNLISDLESGVDFHCKNLSLSALAEGKSYEEVYELCKTDPEWKNKRKKIKPFTFQEKYGGGKALMAEATGLTQEQIAEIINEKRKAYPQEAAFDDMVLESARASRKPSPVKTEAGRQAGIGWYQCVTGTTYHFIERDTPKWLQDSKGIYTDFSPTTTRNYPSQGLGGEITEIKIGETFKYILSLSEQTQRAIKMVNTVHDCQWLDVHKVIVEKTNILQDIKKIMEDVVPTFKALYGNDRINWTTSFPVDMEYGKSVFKFDGKIQ